LLFASERNNTTGDLEGLGKRVEEVVSVKWRGGLGCAWTQRGGARHEGSDDESAAVEDGDDGRG